MSIHITPNRQQILDVLKANTGTLSVANISQKLPNIDLVTIYRNLNLFVKEKLIKQVHLGAGEAQYEYQDKLHHHAVCTDCHKVIHFAAPDEKIRKLLGLSNFQVNELEVTVRGICDHSE